MAAQRTPVRLSVGTKVTDHIAPIYRGDAFAHRFRFTDLAGEEGDWTWKAQIARSNNTDALVTFTIDEDVDDADLLVTLTLTGAQTLALPTDRSTFKADLQRKAGSGDPETLFRWDPYVTGQVTT